MRRSLFISAFLALGIGAGAVIAGPMASGHDGASGGAAIPISLIDIAFIVVAAVACVSWIRTRAYQLPPGPQDGLSLPPEFIFALLAGMLIAPLLSMQVMALLDAESASAIQSAGDRSAPPRDLATQVKVNGAAALGQLVIGGVYLWLLSSSWRGYEQRGLVSERRWPRLHAAAFGALLLLGVFPIVAVTNLLVVLGMRLLGGDAPAQIAHETLESIITTDEHVWRVAMIAIVVVAVPIVEELLYRGLIQELLSRLRIGHWPAIIITSAAFAAAHLGAAEWHVIPSLFVLSLALGWVYAKTGRLIAPIALHAAFNAANTAIGLMVAGG